MITEYNTYFDEAFQKVKAAPQALVGLCQEKQLDTAYVEFDSREIKNLTSVDVARDTGGRYHKMTGFDTVKFKIPAYNDYTQLTEAFFLERGFGQKPYSAVVADAVAEVTRIQGIFSNYQANSKNKQVADGLLNGRIVLADTTKIEFNKKETHDITVAKKFSDPTAKILDNLGAGCQLIVDDAKIGETEFHFITNGKSINSIITNDDIQKAAQAIKGIDRVALGMPVEKTPGMSLSGRVSAAGFIINIWSYNANFTVPEGFGFAGEGKTQYFIPDDRAILLPKTNQLMMYYGGLVSCPVGSGNIFKDMQLIKEKEYNYQYGKAEGGTGTIEFGVKSAPLFVPKNPDGYVSFSNIM